MAPWGRTHSTGNPCERSDSSPSWTASNLNDASRRMVAMYASTAASSAMNFAVATCSGRGAHAPTWPMMSFIGLVMSAGPTAQPTRRPVDANALEIASTAIVYGATSGTSDTGFTWFTPAVVSIQYT